MMGDEQTRKEPLLVQIRVQGRLDESWSDWFDGLAISLEKDNSTLTGKVADQVALRSVLNMLWDINMTLLSVNPVETTADGR